MRTIQLAVCTAVVLTIAGLAQMARAIQLPGTAHPRVADASDDFEDPAWTYIYNPPKSSMNASGNGNLPAGFSTAGYLHEGTFYSRFVEDTWRGQPEVVQRTTSIVANGTGALELATFDTGDGSFTDAISWQQYPALDNTIAVAGNTALPSASMASSSYHLYVPPPSTWSANYPFWNFAYIGTDKNQDGYTGASDDVPDWIGVYFYTEAGSPYLAWETGSDLTGEYAFNTRLLSDNDAGWWTLGFSTDTDKSYAMFAHRGLAPLTMADLLGTYDDVDYFFGDFVGNFQIRHSLATMGPSWVIDDLDFFAEVPVVPEPASLALLGLSLCGALMRRR